MAADRIRVFIAGNIYVKRALVRRFLEDDGFEVVGEARSREDMVAAVRREQPDAIVIDDELLTDGPGGGTMGRVRRGSPDAKVIVFTATPPEVGSAPQDADGYLEKGLGLASLTALLGRLFAASAPRRATAETATDVELMGLGTNDVRAANAMTLPEDAGEEPATAEGGSVGAGVGAGLGGGLASGVDDAGDPVRDVPLGALTSAPSTRSGPNGSGRGARTVAIAAGSILIVWGLVAMIASGGNGPATRALDRTDTTGGTVVEPPADEPTPLEQAYATLDDLLSALEGGNYVLATVDAQALMDLRERAGASGSALTGLDAEITVRLEGLVGDLPGRVNTALAGILGSLYPTIAGEATQPGGGSDVVLGTVVTYPALGQGGPRPTPDTTGGNGSDPGSRPGPGPEPAPPGPGDGRAWGQSHHPDGGWHGEHPGNPHGSSDHPDGGWHGEHPGNPHGPSDHERTEPGKPPWAGGP